MPGDGERGHASSGEKREPMRLRSLKQEQELRALERETRRLGEPEDGSVDRVTVLWRAKWWIVAIALVAGIAAYGVSRFAVSPTYSSSVDVVITAHGGSGGLSDAIPRRTAWPISTRSSPTRHRCLRWPRSGCPVAAMSGRGHVGRNGR